MAVFLLVSRRMFGDSFPGVSSLSFIKHLPHLFRQCLGRKGLLDKRKSVVENSSFRDPILRVPGHVEHPDLGGTAGGLPDRSRFRSGQATRRP